MAGWYLRRGEKVIGPVDAAKLKEAVVTGKILPTDQLATDAAGPWTEAHRTQLFIFAPQPPLPQTQLTTPSPDPPPPETSKGAVVSGCELWFLLILIAIIAALFYPVDQRTKLDKNKPASSQSNK